MSENATPKEGVGGGVVGDLDQKKLKIELSVHHPTTFHFQIKIIGSNLHLIIHPELCRVSKIQTENFSEILSILKPQFHFHYMLI